MACVNLKKTYRRFLQQYSERKDCKSERSLTRYYDNNDKISNQRKTYNEKNREKLLQKQNDRCIHLKKIIRKYVELEKRLEAIDENLIHNK